MERIRGRKVVMRQQSRVNRKQNTPVMPRQVRGRPKDKHDRAPLDQRTMVEHLGGVGVETEGILKRGRKRDRSRDGRGDAAADAMDTELDTAGMGKGGIKRAKKATKDAEKVRGVKAGSNYM